MDVFKTVKQNTDIVKACDLLGIKLNKSYKALCPFHNEKTPSFSVSKSKQIWSCFGCNQSGDVISLTSRILNISSLNACRYLIDSFSLPIKINGYMPKITTNSYKQKQEALAKFKEWENKTFQLLCDYLHSLKEEERLQEENIINYYIDIFADGTDADKLWFKKTNQKVVQRIERKLGR